jgi:hypothetical protein
MWLLLPIFERSESIISPAAETHGQIMNYLTYIFGGLAACCAIVAAVYAYKASTTEARPVWDDHPELRPKNMAMHNFGWLNALGAAQFWSGYYSKRAALWGIASAIFALLSAATAWMA